MAAAEPVGNVVPLRRAGVPRPIPAPAPRGDWLGQALLDADAVAPGNLLKATVIARREAAPLAEVLLARSWVTPAALRQAMARRWKTGHADLGSAPPDPRLIDAAGIAHCLAHRIVPWRRLGGVTWVATSRPEGFEAATAALPRHFGATRMVLVDEDEVEAALLATRRTRLIREAELRTPAAFSCRLRDERRTGEIAVLLIGLLALGLAAAPLTLLAGLTLLALAILAAASAMKAIAAVAQLRAAAAARRGREALGALAATPPELKGALPVISVMVPMFREADIAARLVHRLSGLSYPRELMDILLVVEECDGLTRDALAEARLPRWMRVIVVPDGPLRTKPRALNYALNFCRGSIIGVWDAEDWPEPEQLHKVARAFDAAAPEVVCLQGNLDFYNPKTNWLARCFTIEYASWFRVVLSGMARLRLFVPLGGTTLFFRRGPLEQIGAWDAWNVTEDADLGMRLMRRGWRTEMLDTTTHEEANCRPRPWVKQRSRWHKGYFMTWATHMREPLRLWREIGPRAFLSFQLQMLGTVTAFLIAPVLWTWWMLSAGLGHPLAGPLQALWAPSLTAVLVLVIGAELVNLAIGLAATREGPRRHLTLWLPTMPLYFTLGTFAAWKAIYEVVTQPFYWDKTMHGLHDGSAVMPAAEVETAAPDAGIVAVASPGRTGSVGLVGRIG
ncbi:glycosyltransferase [Paracoccus sp. S-4012]|nr:glycosyltransferase [Paracoccus sp. S-4012]